MRAEGFPRRVGVAMVALVASAGVVLALVAAHRLAPKHLLTVTPGVLYRSATLSPEQLEDVIERYGIRTVVNLRSGLENQKEWHSVQAELLGARGVRMVDLPMNSGFPPDDASLRGWLDVLADDRAKPVLVHCEYGVVRTGVMVSVYEMEMLGRSGAGAWRDFELFGGDLKEPIRSRLAAWIEGYAPRMSADAS